MTPTLTLIRVVDTETTGIDDPCEMVELGWTDIRLFPDGWAIERGPEAVLVNPGMPITFPAMAVHHITDEEARFGIDPDEARAEVMRGVDYVAAHNWAFDSRFIRTGRPAICTFKAARTAWPELQSHGNGAIRYERRLVPADDERAQPSHRAGPDTWVTAHILLDLLKTYTVEQLVDITKKPVRMLKMSFGKHAGVPFTDIPGDYLDWLVNKSDMARDPKKEDVIFSAKQEIKRRRTP